MNALHKNYTGIVKHFINTSLSLALLKLEVNGNLQNETIYQVIFYKMQEEYYIK